MVQGIMLLQGVTARAWVCANARRDGRTGSNPQATAAGGGQAGRQAGSVALAEPRRDAVQLAVHLARWRPQDEGADGVTCRPDVLEGAQDVDAGVGQHDARPRRILNRELRLAVLACGWVGGWEGGGGGVS